MTHLYTKRPRGPYSYDPTENPDAPCPGWLLPLEAYDNPEAQGAATQTGGTAQLDGVVRVFIPFNKLRKKLI